MFMERLDIIVGSKGAGLFSPRIPADESLGSPKVDLIFEIAWLYGGRFPFPIMFEEAYVDCKWVWPLPDELKYDLAFKTGWA